jgi:hypothetical protein
VVLIGGLQVYSVALYLEVEEIIGVLMVAAVAIFTIVVIVVKIIN